MVSPPLPLASTVMVPVPPVESSSGATEVPVAWLIDVPLTEMLPEAEIMLAYKFAWLAAVTVTLPEPVVTVLLIVVMPTGEAPPESRVTLPEPVTIAPGVDKLPFSERKSILPVSLLLPRLSEYSVNWVPAHSWTPVFAPILPVSRFMLSVAES